MRTTTVLATLGAAGFVAARPQIISDGEATWELLPGDNTPEDPNTEITDGNATIEIIPSEEPAEPTEPAEPMEEEEEEEEEEPMEGEISDGNATIEPEEPMAEEPTDEITNDDVIVEPLPEPYTPETPSPFEGKKLFANPEWAAKLEETKSAFESRGENDHADLVTKIQDVGTFVWVSNTASLVNIDRAIAAARAEQAATGVEQIVGLVLYNLPDRDCSAGESAGELSSADNGMNRYKNDFIDRAQHKLDAASDLTFAVVLEPDSLGNAITNTGIEFCAQAIPVYEEGIAYAIARLQQDHVNLYMDAAHGGWLGWEPNLEPSAKEFAKVVAMAREVTGQSKTNVRGFSTNVSNYNPFRMPEPLEPYTEWSNSYDEDHYALSLSPYLEQEGLPANFIIDQGRVHLPGAREEWGMWCNVAPAGFGLLPGTPVDNPHVDSIVWIKPGGESDGECGMEGATRAGAWFDEYAQMLVENTDASMFE